MIFAENSRSHNPVYISGGLSNENDLKILIYREDSGCQQLDFLIKIYPLGAFTSTLGALQQGEATTLSSIHLNTGCFATR